MHKFKPRVVHVCCTVDFSDGLTHNQSTIHERKHATNLFPCTYPFYSLNILCISNLDTSKATLVNDVKDGPESSLSTAFKIAIVFIASAI